MAAVARAAPARRAPNAERRDAVELEGGEDGFVPRYLDAGRRLLAASRQSAVAELRRELAAA